MKKGEAYILNTILGKIKITGTSVSSDTRQAVMSSKIAVSAIVKKFDEDRLLIKNECSENEESTYQDLVNAIAIEEVDIELRRITTEQFDTLLSRVELTTYEVEVLYEFMLLS